MGYDETLLAAIPRAGNGNHVFADNPDAAGAAIAGEVDGLLANVAQAASLIVTLEEPVEFARLYNDLPMRQIADNRLMIELGDFFGADQRSCSPSGRPGWRRSASRGSRRWSWPASSFRR